MKQYGLFIDQSRCIGCNACTVSCAQWHDIQPGSVKWMRVHQWEKGAFPNTRVHILPVPCFHCGNPACVNACPNGAIYKEEKYGAVLVDTEKCRGTRKCWQACPYGAPQFQGDNTETKMSKCTMCIDRLDKGLKPICVLSCSMRALEFGELEMLKKKYGTLAQLEDMPKQTITSPAVIFKPAGSRKPVVNWDDKKALELWQKRDSPAGEPLPAIINKISDVTNPSKGIIGRDRLVLKPKNSEDLLYFTMDDE